MREKTMRIKQIASIAIIAALPCVANAENISGAMYVAPQEQDENHPAPTTDIDVGGHFGRINIDTTDQGHIATTAYVKGAYNSAIAAVNAMSDNKQEILLNSSTNANISSAVFGAGVINDMLSEMDAGSLSQQGLNMLDDFLISTAGVVKGIKSQRVKIYTTWDNDTDAATTLVPFVTASSN